MKKILILSISAILCMTSVIAQNRKTDRVNETKKEKTEQKQKSKKIIDSIKNKKYEISVTSASPMSGKTIHLNYPYYLKVSNDSAYVELPYFGVAYSAPYGGGEGGVKARNKYENYKLDIDKKDKYKITFNIRGNEDFFRIFIDIWPSSGRAYIYVQSNNKQGISYNGDILLQ